jgi:DNA-binding IclR family transcriptional regulator
MRDLSFCSMRQATATLRRNPLRGSNQAVRRVGERVEAVERALLLLQCFEKPGEELTLAALAQRSGFYKSTILRLAASLAHMGFIKRNTAGLFGLGAELRRLGALSHAKVSLEPLVRPVLEELVARTQETASFYVRDGNERICLYRVNSPRSARHHLNEGARHPFHSGAAGIILRAFDPVADHDPDASKIRARGWATSDGGRDPDLAAVAVPLLNRQGELLGVLSVSGLRSRFKANQFSLARTLLTQATAALQPRLPTLAMADLVRDG